MAPVWMLAAILLPLLGGAGLLLLKKKMAAGKSARITFVLYILAEFVIEWLRDGSARQIAFGEVRFNQIVLLGLLFLLVAVSAIRAKKNRVPAEPCAEQEPAEAPVIETEQEPAAEPEQPEPAGDPAIEAKPEPAAESEQPEPVIETEEEQPEE